jgi:hypothetical protein
MSRSILIAVAVFLGFALLMGGCTFIAGWHNYDREVWLRNAILAKSNSNEAQLDTMRKILAQKVQIGKVSTKQMQSIYADLLEGRKGGSLFKMVSEQYPDPQKLQAVWLDIMGSVEAERKGFLREQKSIQDYVAERKSLTEGWMSRKLLVLFGGDIQSMRRKGHPEADGCPADHQYVFVTSSETERISETGREDNIDLGLEEKSKK